MVVHSQCFYALLRLRYLQFFFIDANTKIKVMQIGDHEIKIVNFADDTTIFSRGFSCLTKTELILE